MDWLTNVIIPALTLLFYIIILGFILFVVIRFFIRLWTQKLKMILRYSIFRTKYDDLIVRECLEAIEKNWNIIKFKMYLLTQGYEKGEIYEILYIYNKIKREMGVKDEIKNERRFKKR